MNIYPSLVSLEYWFLYRQMYRLIVITVPLVLLLGSVWSYPNGADEGACSTLAPYHNNGQTQPQQSQSPNGIKVDKSKWAANGTLTGK